MDCHKQELAWLAHLFLLPYYKYLLKQPWQLYESDDTETLRLLKEFPIGYQENCPLEKNEGEGGEIDAE